jgi:hypothetical protein
MVLAPLAALVSLRNRALTPICGFRMPHVQGRLLKG